MPKRIEEIKIGFCCNCDVKIMDLKQRDPKLRKLPNYREHHFRLNNNSLMKIAVCEKCDRDMDQEKAKHIMDRHHKTWKKEIEISEVIPEEKKKKALEYHLSLVAEGFKINKVKFFKEKNKSERENIEKDQEEKLEQEKINHKKHIERVDLLEKKEMEQEKNELKINAKINGLGN